jgi:hypothetical protein
VPPGVSPAELKRMIGDRLRAHKIYREMLEEKSRCWRLNYEREFHLDIIPAKPKYPQTNLTPIFITDKELRHWLDSDPKGYIAWFKLRRAVQIALSNRGAAANVEPAPVLEDAETKSPLQIAIQILKRHRDVMFQNREDGPISIIITTLAAHAYRHERSVAGTVWGVLERMPTFIDYRRGYPCVVNPTNAAENFADRWRSHPERHEAFHEWNAKARTDLDSLCRAVGLTNVRDKLAVFLGTKRADIVLNRMAERTHKQRSVGLKVDTKTGLIGVSAGIVVPRANFYGDPTIQL